MHSGVSSRDHIFPAKSGEIATWTGERRLTAVLSDVGTEGVRRRNLIRQPARQVWPRDVPSRRRHCRISRVFGPALPSYTAGQTLSGTTEGSTLMGLWNDQRATHPGANRATGWRR